MKNLDKYTGCLIGGAAGDALGYPVEFKTIDEIKEVYGKNGITQYDLYNGKARISDDTQMTMYTANGMLVGNTCARLDGVMDDFPDYIALCYEEWYLTQVTNYPLPFPKVKCWISNIPEMFVARAPGNTCLEAISSGCNGTIKEPINNSKGCGGIMRVAPIGLFFYMEKGFEYMSGVTMTGADTAALTHGHPLGYIPAAALCQIVNRAVHSDFSLREIIKEMKEDMNFMFEGCKYLDEFNEITDKAVRLADQNIDDVEAISQIGEGWVAEETLAIAIYCALKYENDFDKAIIAAVNHSGDSDSTGAVTGNILGAYLGIKKIPEKYIENLELKDVIIELARDLHNTCILSEYGDFLDPTWEEKYVKCTYKV